MMRVAFIGLGAIGRPMAAHLSRAPFDLTIWNRSEDKSRAFADEYQVHVSDTPAAAGRGAAVVITCLPSSREVEEVLTGENGLEAGLEDGALLVDCTSGDPAASVLIARRLEKSGVAFVDAPVSGGVKGAIAGNLIVMCGGEVAAVDRARPVLAAFSGKIVHCGDVGAGHAVKAMNQALLAVHIWSAGEVLAILSRFGVPAATGLEVINGSSGRSNTSENLFPERVLGRAYPRTFRLGLLDKDVSIAAGIAQKNGTPSPFIDLAARLFAEAHAALGDEADHVEAVKLIEERAGVRIS